MEGVLEPAEDRYGFDMGGYSRPVRTSSPEAQRWFDRGLAWCYGFNHEEAIRCFERAVRADPDCAMAHWGIAYAAGCNYNKPWEAFLEGERAAALSLAYDEARAAQAAVERAGADAWPAERALIGAVLRRYPAREAPEGTSFQAWNDGYAAAMRDVYCSFPDDPDVAALFAEALINRTPWALWDLPTGKPKEGADTLEAQEVLERAIAAREEAGLVPHAGQLHAYLHTMEMSPTHERALRAADALRDLVPDAGHLRHMASHIDVLCGHYHESLAANERAIVADDKYFEATGEKGFYTLYRCHDIHFKIYSAMFLGQLRPALEGAGKLREALPESVLRIETPPMADWTEGFLGMGVHALVRFGRWHDLLELPIPDDPELYCVTTAMTRYGRGIAYAALGEVEKAEAEQRLFRDAVERVPESRTVFNNTCRSILGVAEAMLDGELTYRKGAHDEAFAKLRHAAALSDGLTYDEPWGWMQPVRHALGALLLEQGRVEEALEVYRDDLGVSGRLPRAVQHPDNVWAISGLVECLERLGRGHEAEPYRQRLALAKARADVEVDRSCYCRLDTSGAHAGHHHERHGHGGHGEAHAHDDHCC